MLLNVLIAWIYLSIVFFGTPNWFNWKRSRDPAAIEIEKRNEKNISKLLKQKYADLGSMTFHEKGVFFLFVIVVLLWFFRDPKFIKGWGEYIETVEVGDSTVAMFVVILLFIVPNSLSYFTGGIIKLLSPLSWINYFRL